MRLNHHQIKNAILRKKRQHMMQKCGEYAIAVGVVAACTVAGVIVGVLIAPMMEEEIEDKKQKAMDLMDTLGDTVDKKMNWDKKFVRRTAKHCHRAVR